MLKISKDMAVEMIEISVFMYVYHADVIIVLPESLICGHLFSLSHMNQKQTCEKLIIPKTAIEI